MTNKIKTGVILIESQSYSSTWRLVRNLDLCGLDRGIREAERSVFDLGAWQRSLWMLAVTAWS